MPLDVSSARGFNEQQLQDYWAANTALQAIFSPRRPTESPNLAIESHLSEELRRAAASLVGMGLKKVDFQGVILAFERMDLSARVDMRRLKSMGLSMEQVVSWLRAPETASEATQVVTREGLLTNWEQGLA